MLNTTIHNKHHIDIDNFKDLKKFVNKSHTGYVCKQAETFSPEDIEKFMSSAPDIDYLVMKVLKY